MSKRLCLLLSLALELTLSVTHAVEAFTPAVIEPERYESVWQRRPFSPATPVEATAQVDGIEQRFSLGGLLKVGDQWRAFVLDRRSLQRQVVSETTNEAGLQLVSVQEQTDSRNSTIVIRLEGQSGMVRFDPGLLNATPPSETSNEKGAQPATTQASPAAPAVAANSSGNSNTPPTPARTLRRTPITLTK